MKTWLKISLWVVLLSSVVFLLIKSNQSRGEALLQEPKISIVVKGENAFINKEELLGKLKRRQFLYDNQKVSELNIEKMEEYIRSISHVKDVNIYTEIDGNWVIRVELRKPIVRVFNRYNESYYLDEDGIIMNTTLTYTARVPVASGEIISKREGLNVPQIINNDTLISILKLDDIYWISDYVCNDPLFQSLIGQIYVEKNGDIVLTPLVGDQKIMFGTANSKEEVEKKFDKLRIFYNEAMPYEGWKKYESISLKYEEQIVCKKKKTNE